MPEPVRLGYHGSADLVTGFLTAAGVSPAAVRLSQYDIADPFLALRSGRQDVIVVKFGLREADLETSAAVAYDARAAVLSTAHPLAGRDSISIEDLAGASVFEAPGTMPGYVWDEVVPRRTPAGRPLHRVHRARTVPEMMAAVRDGAVHVSLLSLADVAPPGVTVVAIRDLPPAPVSLAWRRAATPDTRVRDLVARTEAAVAV